MSESGDGSPAERAPGTPAAQSGAAMATAESGREGAGSVEPLSNSEFIDDAYLLQQVPDDPGRLLRERLMLQYLRRHGRLH